jgi:hypothetical protein
MPYGSNIITSIFGRRLGLQSMSSSQTGSGASQRVYEVLEGPDSFRNEITTADSTGTFLKATGLSHLTTGLITGGTTGVFRLDPPIPGVEKTLVFGSTSAGTLSVKMFVTLSTGGNEVLYTTAGSSHTVLASSVGAVARLVGVTTAIWASMLTTAQGFTLSTTT